MRCSGPRQRRKRGLGMPRAMARLLTCWHTARNERSNGRPASGESARAASSRRSTVRQAIATLRKLRVRPLAYLLMIPSTIRFSSGDQSRKPQARFAFFATAVSLRPMAPSVRSGGPALARPRRRRAVLAWNTRAASRTSRNRPDDTLPASSPMNRSSSGVQATRTGLRPSASARASMRARAAPNVLAKCRLTRPRALRQAQAATVASRCSCRTTARAKRSMTRSSLRVQYARGGGPPARRNSARNLRRTASAVCRPQSPARKSLARAARRASPSDSNRPLARPWADRSTTRFSLKYHTADRVGAWPTSAGACCLGDIVAIVPHYCRRSSDRAPLDPTLNCTTRRARKRHRNAGSARSVFSMGSAVQLFAGFRHAPAPGLAALVTSCA